VVPRTQFIGPESTSEVPGLEELPPGVDPAMFDTAPSQSYLEMQLPAVPWLPPETPQVPEWAVPEWRTQHPSRSPFLTPGLGISALGDSSMPYVPPPPRAFGPTPPLRLGPFDLRPSLRYGVLNGTGVLSGPGREDATWQHTIAPGIVINAGDHWSVSYSPSIRIFTEDEYDDTVDHTVALNGSATYQNWRFRLNHATAITSDPLIETAQQTDQTTHSTGIGATWAFRPQGVLDFFIAQNIRLTDSHTDVHSWSSQNWYHYAFRPRLNLGLGVGFGYDMVEPGTDMVSERINVRASGPLGDKFSYAISAGTELRQFIDSDASTSISPLAAINLSYQILRKTALSVGLSHDVNTSYYSDQLTENTSIQAGITQHLTERWTFTASGGYRFTSYQNTFGGVDEVREDGSAFATASLGGRILPRIFLSVFYTFRGNDSDQDDFEFDSHQVGMNLTWSL